MNDYSRWDDPAEWEAKTRQWRSGAYSYAGWKWVGTVAGCDVFQGTISADGTNLVAISREEEQVASLFYAPLEDEPNCMEGAIEVDPRWRRRGIASFLYAKAEELSGLVMCPASPHTDLAEAFWQQPDRKFGRS